MEPSSSVRFRIQRQDSLCCIVVWEHRKEALVDHPGWRTIILLRRSKDQELSYLVVTFSCENASPECIAAGRAARRRRQSIDCGVDGHCQGNGMRHVEQIGLISFVLAHVRALRVDVFVGAPSRQRSTVWRD